MCGTCCAAIDQRQSGWDVREDCLHPRHISGLDHTLESNKQETSCNPQRAQRCTTAFPCAQMRDRCRATQAGIGVRPYRCRTRQPIPKVAGRFIAVRDGAAVSSSLQSGEERGQSCHSPAATCGGRGNSTQIVGNRTTDRKRMSAAEIISGPGRLSEYLTPETNATAEAAFVTLRQPSWPKSGFISWPIEPALRGRTVNSLAILVISALVSS